MPFSEFIIKEIKQYYNYDNHGNANNHLEIDNSYFGYNFSSISIIYETIEYFEKYRFGFGGHEKDDEVKGSNNHLTFGDYGYDSRIARRWRPDPQMSNFSSWSPYVFSFNNPILFTDRDGEVPIIVIDEQSKTIMIYQPVFVVTKGPGAMTVEQIHNLQNEFNENIVTSHLQAISNSTGQGYAISIQFQFFEGGTFEEAKQKEKEAGNILGMRFFGTFSSFENDADFEQKYKDLGGKKNPKTIGGFTANNSDIYMRGSKATWRERLHEGWHLLFASDATNAVGILMYTDGYGIGPGVNLQNIQEVLNKSILNNPSNIFRFSVSGDMKQGDFSRETFEIQNKPPVKNTGRGSGMGGLYISNLENSIIKE